VTVRDATRIDVDGTSVRITTPGRVLYPRAPFTKGQMLAYYHEISSALLPHIAERPVTLRRFPEGVDGNTWYQTRCGSNRPEFVDTCVLTVPGGEPQDYCVVNDVAGVLWAANLSAIELHPLLMRTSDVDTPTMMMFDLDPGEGTGLIECCRVALVLKEALAAVGLRSFAKTSGSLGLHVVVPLNMRATFEQTKSFARIVAKALAESTPRLVVDRQAKGVRAGKVLVDWLQNDWRRSTVAPYSLRAGEFPTVSMPLDWVEIHDAVEKRSERDLWFGPRRAVERLDRDGDPFADAQTLRQPLPAN
jgi:bifunctional non-homologous end joining protein LigD